VDLILLHLLLRQHNLNKIKMAMFQIGQNNAGKRY
jgi:hypothetical protein